VSELNLDPEANPLRPTPESPVLSKPGWKGPVLATLLSLLFPGLGQWRNRDPRKGFLAAVTFPLLAIITGYSRILLSFWGFIGFITLRLFLLALICVDAFRRARQGRESRKPFHDARLMYLATGVLILTFTIFPATDYFLRKFGYFRAFKVPSASMCPTICEGDRIVADMYAYLKNAPQRGDLILLDFRSKHDLFSLNA
jgi:amino acid transporter